MVPYKYEALALRDMFRCAMYSRTWNPDFLSLSDVPSPPVGQAGKPGPQGRGIPTFLPRENPGRAKEGGPEMRGSGGCNSKAHQHRLSHG